MKANPWQIIGWIVLGFMLLMMYSCYNAFRPRTPEEIARFERTKTAAMERAEAAKPAPPRYEFTVTGVKCDYRGSYTTMAISGRNTGSITIPFAKLYATIGGIPENGYFNPSSIPPGSVATAEIMAQLDGACGFVGIQDREGYPVTTKNDLPD